MDRHLKERLVGAAVLVAAAIILIPEMLSGPHDSSTAETSSPGGSAASGVKTYTIDLTAPNGKAVHNTPAPAPTFETTPAPPPETQAPIPADDATASKESNPQSEEKVKPVDHAARQRDQQLLQDFAEQEKVVEKKHAEKTVVAETVQAKPAEKGAVAVAGGAWAVQVASFGVRATSERIASELKAKGYPAFVTSFAGTGQTMYRVRVGPVEDRPAAEALLKNIKPLHPGAAIVAQ